MTSFVVTSFVVTTVPRRNGWHLARDCNVVKATMNCLEREFLFVTSSSTGKTGYEVHGRGVHTPLNWTPWKLGWSTTSPGRANDDLILLERQVDIPFHQFGRFVSLGVLLKDAQIRTGSSVLLLSSLSSAKSRNVVHHRYQQHSLFSGMDIIGAEKLDNLQMNLIGSTALVMHLGTASPESTQLLGRPLLRGELIITTKSLGDILGIVEFHFLRLIESAIEPRNKWVLSRLRHVSLEQSGYRELPTTDFGMHLIVTSEMGKRVHGHGRVEQSEWSDWQETWMKKTDCDNTNHLVTYERFIDIELASITRNPIYVDHAVDFAEIRTEANTLVLSANGHIRYLSGGSPRNRGCTFSIPMREGIPSEKIPSVLNGELLLSDTCIDGSARLILLRLREYSIRPGKVVPSERSTSVIAKCLTRST